MKRIQTTGEGQNSLFVDFLSLPPSLSPLWFLSQSVLREEIVSVLYLLAGKRRDKAQDWARHPREPVVGAHNYFPTIWPLHGSSITDMACISPGSLQKKCNENAAVLRNEPPYTGCFNVSYHAFKGTIQPSPCLYAPADKEWSPETRI